MKIVCILCTKKHWQLTFVATQRQPLKPHQGPARSSHLPKLPTAPDLDFVGDFCNILIYSLPPGVGGGGDKNFKLTPIVINVLPEFNGLKRDPII